MSFFPGMDQIAAAIDFIRAAAAGDRMGAGLALMGFVQGPNPGAFDDIIEGAARNADEVVDAAHVVPGGNPQAGMQSRAQEIAERGFPEGFNTMEDFELFGNTLYSELHGAGYTDVIPAFAGSSASGVSFRPGVPFDASSDYDIALISPQLMARAQELGIQLRSQGTRTAPLTQEQLELLGLGNLATELSAQAGGREVNFMIYLSEDVLAGRGQPYLNVPTTGG
ncbi:MAG: hypothetical protein SF123_13835 [Chloroflexota bacterium]|nr:hypothetical protein [Chloroflexota bacterium]